MKRLSRTKLISLTVVVALLLGAALTSAALAALPFFSPNLGTFTTLSKISTVTFAKTGIVLFTCTSGKAPGSFQRAKVDEILTLAGCTSATGCPAAVSFEIFGELGAVSKQAEATKEIGVFLNAGDEFDCGTNHVKISGTIAGEVTPLPLSSKHEFRFIEDSSKEEAIQSIYVTKGVVHPVLEAVVGKNPPVPLVFKSIQENYTTLVEII